MPSLDEVGSAMKAPLETVLNRWYATSFLRWLYQTSLRQLAEANPAALPQPERKDKDGPEKVPRKAYLCNLLLTVLRDQELGRQCYNSLPSPTRDLVLILTWSRQANVAALEREFGFPVVVPNPQQQRRWYEPFLVTPENGFCFVQRDPPCSWGYVGLNGAVERKDFAVALPHEVRARFRTFVPPPPGYELLFLDEIPADVGTRYECASTAIADLLLVAEFIEQGHMKYTKAERLALTSLRVIHQMTGCREFFPSSDGIDLALLRTHLLSEGAARVGAKARAELLARPDAPETTRSVLLKILADAPFLHEELLGHLPNSHNRGCQYHPASVTNLRAFFARVSSGKWISSENIATYHAFRDEVPSLFAPGTRGFYAKVTRDDDDDPWSRGISVGDENALDLLGLPLLKGYAFLLAAFGMAEIVYDPPRNLDYRRLKKPFLTPFDGLRYVRLTPLGEFVLGQRNTYEIAGAPSTRSVVRLDEQRLLVTCRNPDALTELALSRFLERLAPGRYRLTPKSLLSGCTSRSDLEERIRLFRRVVSNRPPAIWEAFFTESLARIGPLKPEPDYLVFKLDADEELRRLLATDSVLRELALKVEGLRIAVRRGDLKELTKRLEQFGYLNPINASPGSVD